MGAERLMDDGLDAMGRNDGAFWCALNLFRGHDGFRDNDKPMSGFGLHVSFSSWREAQATKGMIARPQPITILVCGPSRRSSRSIADFVIETQPAVGPKFSRAKCKNTALPRPAMRGEVL